MTDQQWLAALGMTIADARVAKLWSQERLAQELGCSTRQVSRYELGRAAMAAPRLVRICRMLGIQLDALPVPA